MRARWEKEEGARGVYQIVVTEIPYQVQKAKLIERIAELLEQKKLPLLDDIHDESAEDIRIVLTPKSRTVDAELLMEQLFRAVRSGSAHPAQHECAGQGPGAQGDEPEGGARRPLSLTAARCWSAARSYRLEKIATRLEVLEGYLAVFLNLDKVIKIIRTEDEPKPKLMKAFSLTDNQAEAILNMRLRSLRKLEEMEIRGEHAALTKERKELTKLLGSEKLKSERLIEEVKAIDAKFGAQDAVGQAPHRYRRRPQWPICRRWPKRRWSWPARSSANPSPSSARRNYGCARSRAIRKPTTPSNIAKAIAHRFWIHAQTTDQLMLLATDGRFFTLDCSKLPGGRGNGEAIRTFIDLPPEADIARCSCMCRAGNCCWPPLPAMASSPTKTTPSP